MAELEKDVVAGIGNKSTGDNIITPPFDATFRQFVVGKDCILDGLELSSDGLTLTAGHCLGKGFQGELKNDITFEAVPQKIYGRFVINHADDTLDHFYIETDPTGKISQPDILKERGEYWLLLYENGVRMVDNNYPENAVNSDTSVRLIEGGTIAASATVEGVLPETLTYNKTVASTEFVQRVVNEQIGYKTVTIGYYDLYKPQLGGEVRIDIGEIKLEKKADFIIATPTRTNTAEYDYEVFSEGGGTHTLSVDSIPSEFISNNDVAFLPVYYIIKDNISSGGRNVSHYEFVKVGNGNIAGIKSGWKINL